MSLYFGLVESHLPIHNSFTICSIIVLGLLIFAVNKVLLPKRSLSALASLGLGTVTSANIITGWSVATTGNAAVLGNVIIANTPQLILSSLYLALNNSLTRMQLAVEWASYSTSRKGLRLSYGAVGEQRISYFLQLPYRLSIPLMLTFIVFHWLVSQSIFLAVVETWDATGVLDHQNSVASCGYSPLAMIWTLVVTAVVILFTVLIGRLRLRGDIPLVGCTSVGISAACHPPKEGSDHTRPVMWGAIDEGFQQETISNEGTSRIGHCTFSSEAVAVPLRGNFYW